MPVLHANLLSSCSFVAQAFLPVLFLKRLFHSFQSPNKNLNATAPEAEGDRSI